MTGVQHSGMISAGHAIVRQLEALDVRRVYCVPGESYLDVLDGLYDSSITTVVCRHEGGAGFMAVAESRLTGRLGVAMVTRGPGAANAAIAVHTAWQDATPMMLFVGLIPVGDRSRESFQEFDLSAWFGTTAKRVVTLDSAARAAEMVADCAQVAWSGRPDPVVIGLPEDILVEPTPPGAVPPRAIAAGAVSPEEVETLTSELRSSSRPLVVVGGDRWTEAAGAELAAWAEQWQVPVVTDWRSQDVVDNAGPGFAGWLGYGRNQATASLLDRADLVCFIGCGNSDVLSDGYRLGLAGRRTVVVDPDPALRTHEGGLDLHIQASPTAFVAAVRATGPGAATGLGAASGLGAATGLGAAAGLGAAPDRGEWWVAARQAQEGFAATRPCWRRATGPWASASLPRSRPPSPSRIGRSSPSPATGAF